MNIRVLFATALLMLSFKVKAESISAIHENNLAVDKIEEDRPREAESILLKALADDPFSPHIRYNLGTAYLLQKRFDRAIKEYQAVARMADIPDDLKFAALFNAAIAAQGQKNIDLSLDFYQAALKVKPDSIEVKKNIELLMSGQAGQSQGEGQGQGQDPNDQNQQGQGQTPNNEKQDSDQQQKDKPKNGQNFTKDELKKIFEELERQEQKVRGLEYGTKGGREKGPGKDW